MATHRTGPSGGVSPWGTNPALIPLGLDGTLPLGWAVEQAGHVQIMPPHADPSLPLWNEHVAWAQPWRDSLPRDVLKTLEPIAVGRWAMLYWASRSPSAFNVLRENARVLWLMVMTAEQEHWTAHHLNQALAGDPSQMLKACGVDRTEWAWRFLKRIPMMAYHRDSYRKLIERLRHRKDSTTGHDAHEPAKPMSRASREAHERALALFIVCPETLDDVTHALAWVIHSDFENCLRLVLLPDPLAHEGAEKQHLVRLAAALLKPRVDAVIHINSQRLAGELDTDWHPELAQAKIHETLTQCVKSLAETIHRVGLIGVDFVDVRNCLEQQGDAWVAMGQSEGPERAKRATQQSVQGLQIDCELSRAQSVMMCVTGGLVLEIQEFDQVISVIQSILPGTTPFLMSSVIDVDMPPGQLQVMIIAAGIHG